MRREVFITGGAGFIGSHLSKRLLNDGYKVTCYDLLDPFTVSPRTVEELCATPRFVLVQGNLLDQPYLTQAIKESKPDLVIHAAAVSSVDKSIADPRAVFKVNAMGTISLLEALRSVGVRRIHHISTDEIYGSTKGFEVFTEYAPMNPSSPYSASKVAAEAIVMAWSNTYNLDFTISNHTNNFGTHQSPSALIPRLTILGLLGKTLTIHGNGEQKRSWTHVADTVDAILKITEQGKPGERYLIGNGNGNTNRVIDIVNRIMSVLGLTTKNIEFVVNRPGQDLGYAISGDRIRSELGWSPKYGLDSMNNVIQWYKDNRNWWESFLSVYSGLQPSTE